MLLPRLCFLVFRIFLVSNLLRVIVGSVAFLRLSCSYYQLITLKSVYWLTINFTYNCCTINTLFYPGQNAFSLNKFIRTDRLNPPTIDRVDYCLAPSVSHPWQPSPGILTIPVGSSAFERPRHGNSHSPPDLPGYLN